MVPSDRPATTVEEADVSAVTVDEIMWIALALECAVVVFTFVWLWGHTKGIDDDEA